MCMRHATSAHDWGCSPDPGSCAQVHAARRALPLATDVALGEVARMTTGFTGADLANLVNEAALLAGRSDKGEAAVAGAPKHKHFCACLAVTMA